MIICHCHRVTAKDAHAACDGPDADWRAVVKATKAANGQSRATVSGRLLAVPIPIAIKTKNAAHPKERIAVV